MSELLPKVHAVLESCQLAYKVLACDPSLADTSQFCEAYGFKPEQSANAIIVAGKGERPKYCCCVVLANTKLDVNKVVCKLLEVKKASFAPAEQTKELTGMEIGGVTPFGLPADLPVFVDAAVMQQEEVVMGGGNRSSKVVLRPTELTKLSTVSIVENLAKPKV